MSTALEKQLLAQAGRAQLDGVAITFEQEMRRELALAYIKAMDTPEGRVARQIERDALIHGRALALRADQAHEQNLMGQAVHRLELHMRRLTMRKQRLLPRDRAGEIVFSHGLYVGII